MPNGMYIEDLSRNPFYSGRFFHSATGLQGRHGVVVFVAIPSIQVGFSIRPRNMRRSKMEDVAIPSIQVGFSIRVQLSEDGRIQIIVAIPSIQVGFSIPSVSKSCSINRSGSQSLLFRSVFPFPFFCVLSRA